MLFCDGENLCAVIRDDYRVFKLGTALFVFGGDRPAVVPHIPGNTAQRQHRFNGEHHTWHHDFVMPRCRVIVRDNETRVEFSAHPVTDEIFDHTVTEALLTCTSLVTRFSS